MLSLLTIGVQLALSLLWFSAAFSSLVFWDTIFIEWCHFFRVQLCVMCELTRVTCMAIDEESSYRTLLPSPQLFHAARREHLLVPVVVLPSLLRGLLPYVKMRRRLQSPWSKVAEMEVTVQLEHNCRDDCSGTGSSFVCPCGNQWISWSPRNGPNGFRLTTEPAIGSY